MNKKIIVKIEETKRLDSYIIENFDDLSRTFIQRLIKEENVLVNNLPTNKNYKVKLDDVIDIVIPDSRESEIIGEDIPINIIYEDDDIIVVNKAKGMVVHPAPGNYNGTLVNALMYACKDKLSDINGVIRPGIVHRIDKNTAGTLVVAKNNNAHQHLAELFKSHDIDREYTALVYGIIEEKAGVIRGNVGRDIKYRKKMAVNVKNGKHAITHFEVIERFAKTTLIKARLETGRTHQIRVHLAYIGHPLVGDDLYGNKKDYYGKKGQMLVANYLGFEHPTTKEIVEFEVELPDEFKELLAEIK